MLPSVQLYSAASGSASDGPTIPILAMMTINILATSHQWFGRLSLTSVQIADFFPLLNFSSRRSDRIWAKCEYTSEFGSVSGRNRSFGTYDSPSRRGRSKSFACKLLHSYQAARVLRLPVPA